MRTSRCSCVSEVVACGVVFPVVILFNLTGVVILHFRCCEWDVDWNPNSGNLSSNSQIVAFVHARQEFSYEKQYGGVASDTAGACFIGIVVPTAMFLGGTGLTVFAVARFCHRSQPSSPMLLDRRARRLVAALAPRRFQFSLLVFVLLMILFSIVLKATLMVLQFH